MGRRKLGRDVLPLSPPGRDEETAQAIDMIVTCRNVAGICKSNPFIFTK